MGANISASNITSSSAYLYASWSGLLRPNGAVIMCNGEQVAGWWYEAGVENNCGGTISGLSPSTTYTANVTVWDEGEFGAYDTVTFTTLSATPSIVVGTPSIGSFYVNGTTASINFSKGANNEFVQFEVKTSPTENANILETFNSYSSPISHEFPYEDFTFYIRARGVYGGIFDTDWSDWTPFQSLTTEPILVVGVPSITNVEIFSDLRVNMNFVKGGNNTEVEIEFSKTDGTNVRNFLTPYPTNFSTTLSTYQYNTAYRVRIRGNYNYGTKYSSWSGYTNFSTGSDPNGRPLNWSWSYNIASGQPVLKAETSADKKNIIAYIFSTDEWTSFLERINAFRFYWDYKHGTHIGQIGFDNIGHNFEFTPSKMNDAINAINTMGYTIPTVSSVAYVSGGLASLLNYMKDCLNSIV